MSRPSDMLRRRIRNKKIRDRATGKKLSNNIMQDRLAFIHDFARRLVHSGDYKKAKVGQDLEQMVWGYTDFRRNRAIPNTRQIRTM